MKKMLFLAILLSYCQMNFAEYAVIDHIVYYLNFDRLTATVLNFQTSRSHPCTVTIPETVIFKKDSYKVTRLSYYAFDYNAITNYQLAYSFFGSDLADLSVNHMLKREKEEEKYEYDYKNSRANIEYINLPNTLLVIDAGAFDGMIRLKQLKIPASVTTFDDVKYDSEHLLKGRVFPRLERIEVLGVPTCERLRNYETYELNILSLSPDGKKYDYMSQMAWIIAGIDSTGKTDICPNLKSFTMPVAQAKLKIAQAKLQKMFELQSYCSERNDSLIKIVNDFNSKLQKYPYFDGSQLALSQIDFQNNYTKDSIDQKYRLLNNQFTQQFYELLNGKMELYLRTNNTAKYIEVYQSIHPEQKQVIDSVYREYRCYDLDNIKDSLALQVIDKKTIPLIPCREQLYNLNHSLFANKSEFDASYDIAIDNEEFELELSNRRHMQNQLKMFKDCLLQNNTEKLQGLDIAKKGFLFTIKIYLNEFKRTFYYKEAVQAIFDINEPIIAEYKKNGHYFSTKDDFFNAYISTDYKAVLKAKKQNK